MYANSIATKFSTLFSENQISMSAKRTCYECNGCFSFTIELVGGSRLRSNCVTTSTIHSCSLGKRSISCCTSIPQCWIILCISSCTSSTHRNEGSSSFRICRLTSNSKETSGTKRAGLGPVALRIAVSMSTLLRSANGLIESRVLPKVS